MRRSKRIWRILFAVLVIILFGGSILFMFLGDRCYFYFENWINMILKTEHHYSGEVWYSAAVSMVGAFPGTVCGILAFMQAERLHELEDRYHRPSLVLHKAQLSGRKVSVLHKNREEYLNIGRYIGCLLAEGYLWDAELSIEFEVENGVTIEEIEMIGVDFIFQENKKYSISLNEYKEEKSSGFPELVQCSRKFQDGNIIHSLSRRLYPFDHTELQGFWENMTMALGWEMDRSAASEIWEMNIMFRMSYEYGDVSYITLKTSWNKDTQSAKEDTIYYETSNGFFKY